mmetsp:Transcript_4437/g.7065  ORF Transcript_4437/g.7065 Transcript_4437/m.7065 type:complete len:360 (+) Transcript_4437:232-1311(+)
MAMKKKKKVLSPATLDYLSALEVSRSRQKQNNNANANNNTNTNLLSDNQYSLLKDVINDDSKDDAFFSAAAASASTSSSSLLSSSSDDINDHQSLLTTIAQEKTLLELNNLYEEYTFATAKDASLTDDLRHDADATHSEDSLVYGEIDLAGFCTLLRGLLSQPRAINNNDDDDDDDDDSSSTKSRKDHVFYDLGSGSGRAVFAARFLTDFQNCIGIELLPNLHQLAISVASLYKFQYQHKLSSSSSSSSISSSSSNTTKVQFVCSDLLEYDWASDGTVVYAPSLLFDSEMMEKIARMALGMRRGAYLISLKKFDDGDDEGKDDDDDDGVLLFRDAFVMVQTSLVPMSWGESNVYVYQRQ